MSKCCTTSPGRFTTLIYLEIKGRTSDGQGGWEITWTADPEDGVWAAVTSNSGAESVEADRLTANSYITIHTWFRGDAYGAPYYRATGTRVRIANRIYNITTIQDLDMEGKYLRILAVEGDPS